jgi:Putative restriction endonuclease
LARFCNNDTPTGSTRSDKTAASIGAKLTRPSEARKHRIGYVAGVPPLLEGKIRRSYVLWRELMAPLMALEFASGDGSEERDATPLSMATDGEIVKPGKFWVYERIIRIPYYGIYEMNAEKLEVYHLVDFSYQPIAPNERGHYAIAPLGVELGLWYGSYQNQTQRWVRWWDSQGNLLLIGDERAESE